MKTWFRGSIVFGIAIVLLFSYVPVALFSDLPAVFSVVILSGTLLLLVLLWYWAET